MLEEKNRKFVYLSPRGVEVYDIVTDRIAPWTGSFATRQKIKNGTYTDVVFIPPFPGPAADHRRTQRAKMRASRFAQDETCGQRTGQEPFFVCAGESFAKLRVFSDEIVTVRCHSRGAVSQLNTFWAVSNTLRGFQHR